MGFHKSTLVARGADTQLVLSWVSAPLACFVERLFKSSSISCLTRMTSETSHVAKHGYSLTYLSMWRHNMYINVHLQPNEPMNVDRGARTILERMFKIIYSSPYASHETATSHTVRYWYRITCPSLWKHNVYMQIYSRTGAVPVILSCTDHMFLVFEHAHRVLGYTVNLHFCIYRYLTYYDWTIYISLTFYLSNNLIHWFHVRLCRNGRDFLPRTDLDLQNILIFIWFALINEYQRAMLGG